jgi:rubrerythrin
VSVDSPWALVRAVVVAPLHEAVPGSDVTYFECRHCGTSLDDADACCPHCGESDVARYELE